MSIQLRDFPFWLRCVLVVNLFFLLINGFVFLVTAVAIVAMLSAANVNPAAWTIFGTLLGACIGVVGTLKVATQLDKRRREIETRDVSVSLYAEIADRSARCLSDYLKPWRDFEKLPSRKKVYPPGVAKFRPIDPVVYPSIVAKLGLLQPEALFPVVQFYFRLDALRREIDDLNKDFSHDTDLTINNLRRVALFVTRLRSTLHPALVALEKLEFEGSSLIDREAALAYHHLRDSGDTLREGLKKYSS